MLQVPIARTGDCIVRDHVNMQGLLVLQVLIARTDAARYVTTSNMMAWRCIACEYVAC